MSPAVFAHGHLRLFLLSLLAEQPKHGYELMRDLSDRFGGTYTPSAGTIYPRLGKLQEEGLITRAEDGRKSVYAITDAGRDELERRRGELDGIEGEVGDTVRTIAREVRANVDEAMRSLKAELAAARSERPEQDPATDQRMQARLTVRDAEQAVAEFRAELRAELRTAAARGAVPRELPSLLAERLRAVRDEVRSNLRG